MIILINRLRTTPMLWGRVSLSLNTGERQQECVLLRLDQLGSLPLGLYSNYWGLKGEVASEREEGI